MDEIQIRVGILEEMYRYHWDKAMEMSRCLLFAVDHYSYRDAERSHFMAAEWVAREHMGILNYVESERRLRVIQDEIRAKHESLVKAEHIA